jgi:hypothetical protein
VPPPDAPPVHEPAWQVAPLLHEVHDAPPVPHCESFVAVTQVEPAQQPFGHVVESQLPPTQLPPVQV